MAIKVRRTFRGETSRTADDGKEETWMYDVHTDSLSYTVTQAKTAVDSVDGTNPLKFIPAKGAIHAEDPDLICQEISADRDADLPTLIRVTVQWRSLRNDGQGADGASSDDGSSSEPAVKVWNIELEFDREVYTETRNIDLDKLPLRNVVGDPLEPVEMKKTDAVYIYSYYVKNLDWIQMGEAHGGINENEVVLRFNGRTKTFDAKTLMIEPKFQVVQTLQPAVEGGSVDMVYKVTCRLTHHKEGWGKKLHNIGFNAYLAETGGEEDLFAQRVVDKNGQPKTDPTYLDAEGRPLADGAPVVMLPLPEEGEEESPGFRFCEVLNFATLPGFGATA